MPWGRISVPKRTRLVLMNTGVAGWKLRAVCSGEAAIESGAKAALKRGRCPARQDGLSTAFVILIHSLCYSIHLI